MAKVRHRIFEMYELRDEAIVALTPRTVRPVTEGSEPESLPLEHLAVSRSAVVTHVEFKGDENLREETDGSLRDEFSQLADTLVRDSKVLLDFAGVTSFSAASIDSLVKFNQKLRVKGSRIVLCCLAPEVRQSFFAKSD